MTDDLTRDFKGIWIPKEIWLDSRLNTIDKIILLEIDSLDSTEDGCYASNQYLAKFCQCAESTVSISINKLIKLEYLEVAKFDGRKRYLKSRLLKIKRQTFKNQKADLQNLKEINIDNNIINNKDDKYIYKKHGTYKRIKLTDKEYERLINDYGKDLIDKQIELLDEYVESNNNKNKYTNFNLVLRKSIRENWFKKDILPNWFDKDLGKKDLKEDNLTDEQQQLINKILGSNRQ